MKIIATSRPMIRNQRVNDVPIVDDNLEVCNVLMAKFLSISLTSIDSLRGFSSVLQSRVFVFRGICISFFRSHLHFIRNQRFVMSPGFKKALTFLSNDNNYFSERLQKINSSIRDSERMQAKKLIR